ncbi:unnamed protein product, partial [Amoebophrya sp. A25]|eukprot:GSA25T00027981001.1
MLKFRTLAARTAFGFKEEVTPLEITHFRGVETNLQGQVQYDWIPIHHWGCSYEVQEQASNQKHSSAQQGNACPLMYVVET